MKRAKPVLSRTGDFGLALGGAILATAAAGCAKPAATAPLRPASPSESSTLDEAPSSRQAVGDDHRSKDSQYETVSLRGRIVWGAEALERRYGIRTVPEARERTLALEAADGRLYPIVEDPQGRAFRRDERLRNRDVELFARHYPDVGMIQVIRLYFTKPEGKFLIDYWCDVCSISMVEDGPCDCCQQPNRLREQLVK